MAKKQRKNDKLSWGFATGFLLPFFIFIIIYLIRYPEVPLFEYLSRLWDFNILIKILSLCVFPNLFIFLLYIRRKMDFAARGVLAATLIYALVVLASILF
ncbi:MAG: hypothetical protein JXR31_01775 [Prolixibacteraceae bacterium]|nr:hypothetical protein [Prolixibacteraceae bacterium]